MSVLEQTAESDKKNQQLFLAVSLSSNWESFKNCYVMRVALLCGFAAAGLGLAVDVLLLVTHIQGAVCKIW